MRHDRAVLILVLVNHRRVTVARCSCGYDVPLGLSYEQHVCDVYENELHPRGK